MCVGNLLFPNPPTDIVGYDIAIQKEGAYRLQERVSLTKCPCCLQGVRSNVGQNAEGILAYRMAQELIGNVASLCVTRPMNEGRHKWKSQKIWTLVVDVRTTPSRNGTCSHYWMGHGCSNPCSTDRSCTSKCFLDCIHETKRCCLSLLGSPYHAFLQWSTTRGNSRNNTKHVWVVRPLAHSLHLGCPPSHLSINTVKALRMILWTIRALLMLGEFLSTYALSTDTIWVRELSQEQAFLNSPHVQLAVESSWLRIQFASSLRDRRVDVVPKKVGMDGEWERSYWEHNEKICSKRAYDCDKSL